MELFREHAQYHERRLEQQMLDALLRIEEILARAFPEGAATEAVDAADVLDNRIGGIVNVLDPDGHKVGSLKRPTGKRR